MSVLEIKPTALMNPDALIKSYEDIKTDSCNERRFEMGKTISAFLYFSFIIMIFSFRYEATKQLK